MQIFCVRCIITDTFLVLWTVDCGELSANIKGIEFWRGILIIFNNIFMFAFKKKQEKQTTPKISMCNFTIITNFHRISPE